MKKKIEAATLTVLAVALYALVTLALGSITPGESVFGIPHKEWPLYQFLAAISHHWWWFSGLFLLCCVISNILDEGLAATFDFRSALADNGSAAKSSERSSNSSDTPRTPSANKSPNVQLRGQIMFGGSANFMNRGVYPANNIGQAIRSMELQRDTRQRFELNGGITRVRLVEIRDGVECGTVWNG